GVARMPVPFADVTNVPPTGSRPSFVLPSTPPGENQAVESAEHGPQRATGPPAVALALEKAGGPPAAGLPIPRRSLDPPFRTTSPSNRRDGRTEAPVGPVPICHCAVAHRAYVGRPVIPSRGPWGVNQHEDALFEAPPTRQAVPARVRLC